MGNLHGYIPYTNYERRGKTREIHFFDRHDAGRKLAKLLAIYKDKDVVVYGLPRGGVVVAVEAAKFLHAPLDLIVVRKIGHPLQPEYAIGAVAANGHITRTSFEEAVPYEQEPNEEVEMWFQKAAMKERAEAQRRHRLYLGDRPLVSVTGKIAILIDDGLATGLTMRAAIREVKHLNPKKIVVAVPIAAKEKAQEIADLVDEFDTLATPEDLFISVGQYYDNFAQVTDQEVVSIMQRLPVKRGD